jgi:hypothetical protein
VPILLVLVLVSGGKSYYAAGMLPPLMAAGGIAADRWLERGRRPRLRMASFGVAYATSLVVTVLLVLPVLPPATFAASPSPDIYSESGEQLGWPELVATVTQVADNLPADQRARAVILTDNYGEAGALELLGTGLPPVVSGHNAYARWGPPPADRTTVIVVTHDSSAGFSHAWGLGRCTYAAYVDNGLGLYNQEQGVGVWVCPKIERPWEESWDGIRHLG